MSQSPQIFQTNKSTRWRSVQWTSRVLAFVAIFFLIVLGLAYIFAIRPGFPDMQNKAKEYEKKLDPRNLLTLTTTQNKKYRGFKDFLSKKEKEDSLKKINHPFNQTQRLPYIRAAFYTPWTSNTSLPDLEKNGDKLNTIFPEWFFIDPKTFILRTRIDSAGLAMMRLKNLRIMPMVSNFNSQKQDFDGNLLHHILNDSLRRQHFITQIMDTLSFYHFQGINVDFEQLNEATNTPLTNFQGKIYEALHKAGMTVTMDLEANNNDYNYKQLSGYNDFVVLMAYDQFNNSTGPGPISAQRWIEETITKTAQQIDPNKIILGLGAFGYDWANNKFDSHSILTYYDAINKAKFLNANIIYDNDNFNLHFNYDKEEEDEDHPNTMKVVPHEVWFTDAAATFNIMRFSDEFATAGTALWRLGSEDQRIWQYYDKDLSNDALDAHPFNYNSLISAPITSTSVGFQGEGEVLDILYKPQEGKVKFQIDSLEDLISEEKYEQLPSGYVIRKFAEDTSHGVGHKLILTFDDGPSSDFTPKILEILEREKIPATFFIVGINGEKNIPILQRIFKDGFEIGNHTFTHHNIAKMSLGRADVEMKLTRLLIETVTGRSTILFRAPFNADSEPETYEELEPIQRSRNENYLTIGESIDPTDWKPGITADSIFLKVVKQVEERNASIILLHDAGGDTRQSTVDALPRIIQYFRQRGYKFTTVADLMGKTRDEVMPKIPNGFRRNMNLFFVEFTYWTGQILFSLFIIGIICSVGRIILMAVLASIQKRKEKQAGFYDPFAGNPPTVSIIVPAYNEQLNAVRTVQSLLNQNYKKLQVIFVDDGSKDDTFNVVRDAFKDVPSVHVYSKPNGGKATALNYGVQICQSEFVVCIDADTQLKSDAVTLLMNKFDNDDIGAVAGNVKVGNEVNMITKWQSIEYITSQNFDRRAFDLLNCIVVVPGAIGAFRKSAIIEAGGFTSDTLAEDCDLTMRLHRCGYKINNSSTAISYTEAPETLKQFMKQRFRWSFGVIQCFWKHRDALFNPRFRNFGMVAMPNILVFQMILPFLAPLADLILILSLLGAAAGIVVASLPHILLYYIIFSVVDIAGAALAFAFEKEDLKKLVWMIPQRLIYRQLMYYILFQSVTRAIKGEMQGWGALKRTGSVREVVASK